MKDFFKFFERLGVSTSKKRSTEDRFVMYSDVVVEIRDKFGKLKHRSEQHNLRTSTGADFWNTQLFGTPGTRGAAYIALTTDTTAPAAADGVLTSEESTNGLARATASVSHTAGASSSQLSHTWTYTGSTSKVIAKVALFQWDGAAAIGTAGANNQMILETLLATTGTVSANGDTITVTWTVNY